MNVVGIFRLFFALLMYFLLIAETVEVTWCRSDSVSSQFDRSTLMATCTVCRDFHQNIWGEIILYLIDYCVCPTADILFIYAAVIGPNFSSAYLASCCLLFHSAKALWFIKCKHWRTVISFAFLLPSATVILPKPLFCSGWCLQPQMAHTPVV